MGECGLCKAERRPPPVSPSLPWRFSSSLIMGMTASISRIFLHGLNYMEVIGLDGFLKTLDKRKDVEGRERGLITGMDSG
jgi:monolysocardiolipin acyltransferase